MKRILSRCLVVALALVLSACVLDLPGAGGKNAAADNAITGGKIEVTPLDEEKPPKGRGRDTTKAKPGPEPKADVLPEPAVGPPGPKDTRPKPRPDAVAAPTEAPVAAPDPAPKVAAAEKTAAQVACERKKGQWSRTGKGGFACVRPTRDGGESCGKAGDCEGQCLARSRTCAPFAPLFGCNEILDKSGRRMTLCLD